MLGTEPTRTPATIPGSLSRSLSRYEALRGRTFQVLEKAVAGDRLSRAVDIVIVAIILANMAAVVLESFEGLHERHESWFVAFEFGSVVVFTIELALRLWTSDLRHPKSSRLGAAGRFLVSPMGMIDVLAILPFYLPLLSVDLRVMRMLRLVRFLRLLKLARYTRSLVMIGTVMRERRDELLVSVVLTSLLLIVASTLMYYLESHVQPDAFPNILASTWWAVATLTTIGYGDVVPLTAAGRLLSGIIAVLGIGLVALPTAIISSGFVESLVKSKAKAEPMVADAPEQRLPPATPARSAPPKCPNCGHVLANPPHEKDSV